jgi:hypothetical protein
MVKEIMIKVGSRVNLVKSTMLITPKNMKNNIGVSKKNPCKGTITAMWHKNIAGRRITMCQFKPDGFPDDVVYEFGLKAFEEITD